MKKLIKIAVLILLGQTSQYTCLSQPTTPTWVSASGGKTAYIVGFSNLVKDKAGYLYSAGFYRDSFSHEGAKLACPGLQAILMKQRPTGEVLWVRQFSDCAANSNQAFSLSICLGTQGELYVSGTFTSLTIAGQALPNNGGSPDVFIVKMDTAANIQWAKSAGGSGLENSHMQQTLMAHPAGGFVIAGNTGSTDAIFGNKTLVKTNTNSTPYIARYDKDGNCLWVNGDGEGVQMEGMGLTVDKHGSIFLTGFYDTTCTFAGQPLPPPLAPAEIRSFCAKYSASGSFLKFFPLDEAFAGSIMIGKGGNMYLALPYFLGAVCYDSTGVAKWKKFYTSSNVFDLGYTLLDEQDNMYVSLEGTGSLSLNGDTVYNLAGSNAVILKWDNSGAVKWAKGVASQPVPSIRAPAIALSGSDLVVNSTWRYTDLTVGTLPPLTFTDQTQSSILPFAFITARLSLPTSIPSSPHQPFGIQSCFTVFPNPASRTATVQLSKSATTPTAISLTEATGRRLHYQYIATGSSNTSIDVQSLAAGVYFLTVSGQGTQKVVVE